MRYWTNKLRMNIIPVVFVHKFHKFENYCRFENERIIVFWEQNNQKQPCICKTEAVFPTKKNVECDKNILLFWNDRKQKIEKNSSISGKMFHKIVQKSTKLTHAPVSHCRCFCLFYCICFDLFREANDTRTNFINSWHYFPKQYFIFSHCENEKKQKKRNEIDRKLFVLENVSPSGNLLGKIDDFIGCELRVSLVCTDWREQWGLSGSTIEICCGQVKKKSSEITAKNQYLLATSKMCVSILDDWYCITVHSIQYSSFEAICGITSFYLIFQSQILERTCFFYCFTYPIAEVELIHTLQSFLKAFTTWMSIWTDLMWKLAINKISWICWLLQNNHSVNLKVSHIWKNLCILNNEHPHPIFHIREFGGFYLPFNSASRCQINVNSS